MIETHETEFDNLLAGHVVPAVTDHVTVKKGQVYKKGTVIGMLDADRTCVAIDSSKTDGSQTPYGIIATEVDATTENKETVVYLTGQFNASKLIFGGTDTVDKQKRALRNVGIFIVNAQK
jgi:hypothetical protein